MNLRFICLGIYSMGLLEIYRTKVRWMMGETKPTGHRRVWSALLTRGGLDVPAGQQPLAPEIGPWSWVVPDSHGGHCSGGVYDGVANTTQKPWHRLGPCLKLQGTTGWESIGQDCQYAAQQIAEIIQGWLPARATDPESQHEITTAPQSSGTTPPATWGWKSRNPKPTTIQPNGCQSRGLPHCPGSPAKKTCIGKPASIQYVFVQKKHMYYSSKNWSKINIY